MNDAMVAALGEGGAAALSLFVVIVFVIFMAPLRVCTWSTPRRSANAAS